MSKNMTRKGLALGTASALVITGLIGTPAFAGGLADKTFVSLAPSSGTEYAVLSGASKTFSLTANEASTIAAAGRNMKFLVTDSASAIEPTIATTGRQETVADNSAITTTVGAGATDVVRIADAALAAKLAVGDKFYFEDDLVGDDGGAGGSEETVASDDTIFTVSAVVANTSFSFTTDVNLADADTDGVDGAVTIRVIREARAADGSYVVNTGSATANSNETLVLSTSSSETATRTVTVEAWVDNNGNDVIDDTEYASPVRTVTFKKGSEVTGSVTVDPYVVGATSVTAYVTTTPALNGNQMSNGDVNAMFTYQGSNVEFTPANSGAVFNTTSRKWVVTAERSVATSNTAVAAGVLTITHAATTAGSNNFTVGEKVKVDVPAAQNDGTYVIATVPGNTSFTATTTSVTNTGAEVGTAKVEIVAGTYSVRPKIGSDYIAAALSVSVAAATSDDGTAAVTETANINSTGNDTDTVVATVRADTLSASAVFSFVDEDDVAVTAGRNVKITVDADGVEGLKVNGTTADAGTVIDAVTDSKGQVTVTVTATDADAGESVDLTAVAEGVSTTSTGVDFDWSDGTIYLYDLNSSSSMVRSIAEGGSYSFNFVLVDTWAQRVTGDWRIKVATSGNNVSETYPSLSTGSATVSVTDSKIATNGDITVTVDAQKKNTAGVWQEDAANAVVPAQQVYTIKTVSQSGGAVTATSADASVATTVAAALAAGDARTSQATVSGDGTAGTDAVEITGTVTNALTGVTRPGAAVTISGDASILFIDGDRAAFGSITMMASSTGTYSIHARSNKVQKDSVVTVSSLGGSKTIKVTFEGAKDDTAAAVSIVTADYVTPGSTLKVTVKLTDKYGNPVVTNGTAADGWVNGTTGPTLKITYDGPGLMIGSLPTTTGAGGEASFTVLLGTNDKGAIKVTATYDGDDSVTTNTNVYTATKTVTIGAAPAAAKVNVGSFNGKLVVYANGYNGKKISWKVGGKWGSAVAASDTARFARVTPRKGVTVSVQIYVDGVLTLTKSVVTK
jgi:hypothetical protein